LLAANTHKEAVPRGIALVKVVPGRDAKKNSPIKRWFKERS
jgi:hypothetical protein